MVSAEVTSTGASHPEQLCPRRSPAASPCPALPLHHAGRETLTCQAGRL